MTEVEAQIDQLRSALAERDRVTAERGELARSAIRKMPLDVQAFVIRGCELSLGPCWCGCHTSEFDGAASRAPAAAPPAERAGITLEEAKSWLRENFERGARCPCCRRKVKLCMELPPGTTCGDCRHHRRCAALICTLKPSNTCCDFFPRRFVPATATAVGRP